VLRAIAREDDRLDCRSDPLQSASLAAGDIRRHRYHHCVSAPNRDPGRNRTITLISNSNCE
jgi:hypothetical protein